MYEITAYLNRKADLDAFLGKTHQFGKKFYRCSGGTTFIKRDGSEYPIMHVMAIAISRDLTYRLHWTIPYEGHVDQEKYHAEQNKLDEQAADGKFPLMNAVPHEDKDKELFYPYLTREDAERPWEDVFASYSFTLVHTIAKDGHTLF